jgi:DNA-binding NarL/FixJ family response regulator
MGTVSDRIPTLIVEPHPAMRRSLRDGLETVGDLPIAGEATDLLAALRIARSARPSVAVVDSQVASLASQAETEALGALARRVPVVVVGMGEPELYGPAYAAAGASGYWAKFGQLDELIETVRAAGSRHRTAA